MKSKIRTYLMLTSLCVSSLIFFVTKVNAFDPDAPNYGHSFLTRSVAGEGFSYFGKTVSAFTATFVTEENAQAVVQFSSEAVEQLVLGTRTPDFLPAYQGIPVGATGINGEFFSNEPYAAITLTGEPANLDAHCDDEAIVGCSTRIWKFSSRIDPDADTVNIDSLKSQGSAVDLLFRAAQLVNTETPSSDNVDRANALAIAARLQAGRALHTLQDFYAHSSWSESFSSTDTIFEKIGRDNTVFSITNNLPPIGATTCVARRIPDSIIGTIFQSFTIVERTGKGLAQLIGLLGSAALSRLGLDYDTTGGNSTYVGVYGATSNSPDSVKVTTSYFDANQTAIAGIESASNGDDQGDGAKCDHGFAKAGTKVAGINKDNPYAPYTPFPQLGSTNPTADSSNWTGGAASPQHIQASFHAAKHTRLIFDNIIKAIDLKSGYAANNADPAAQKLRDKMVELFMGTKPVIALVVDVTGSMQDIMDGIAQQAEVIATQEAALSFPVGGGSTANRKTKFMLTTYGESVSNIPTWTFHKFTGFNANQASTAGTAEQVLTKLQNLPPATGGGDCPEPTMRALLETIKKTPSKSKIYIFTDSSTKDNDITGSDGRPRKESAEVARFIKAKKLEVTFSLSGSCSPISPAYHQIAQASGGQVMLVDHTSADTGVALAGVAPGNRPFSVIHTERSSLAAGASKGIVIAVESGASQLLISVTNDSSAIAVRNPAGELQTLTTFLGGSLLKVSNPAPGNWSIGVSGWPTTPPGAPASAYSIKAQAIGAFDLGTLEYSNKDAAGRSGHEIHMPYGNSPPSTDVRVAAQLSTNAPTNPATYQWEALAEDGTVLGPLNLARKTPDQYEGTAAIGTISANATRPWRVRVRGTDSTGQPFARTLPTLQNATRVTANITQLPNHWVPGAEHLVKIRIDNYGAADGYSLPGSVSLGQLIGITPNAEVPAGDYAIVTAKLSIPANTPANSAGLLKLSLNSRNAANGTLQTINIPYTVLADTDGDGVPDIIEKGSNGIDDNYDGNADGIPDWKQANVISLPSDQRRAYLTASLSAGQFRLARTAPAEGLAQLKYTIDLIDFKITGLAAGAATQMKLQLPGYMTASGYGKFGPVPGNTNAAWYDFNYDAATGLGAKVDKNIVTLYLKDGAKGDDDLTANGEIIDIGGPVGVQIAGAGTANTASTGSTGSTTTTTPSGTASTATTSTPSGSTATTGTGNPDGSGTNAPGANPFSGSSGGGGCTVGDPSNPHPDDSLWLLLLAALGVLGARAVVGTRAVVGARAVQLRQRAVKW